MCVLKYLQVSELEKEKGFAGFRVLRSLSCLHYALFVPWVCKYEYIFV